MESKYTYIKIYLVLHFSEDWPKLFSMIFVTIVFLCVCISWRAEILSIQLNIVTSGDDSLVDELWVKTGNDSIACVKSENKTFGIPKLQNGRIQNSFRTGKLLEVMMKQKEKQAHLWYYFKCYPQTGSNCQIIKQTSWKHLKMNVKRWEQNV